MAVKTSRPRSSLMLRDYEDGGGFAPLPAPAPAPAPSQAPAPAPSQAPAPAPVAAVNLNEVLYSPGGIKAESATENIYQELKKQTEQYNTGKYFQTGAAGTKEGGLGSVDAVLRDMASRLSAFGLTSINELGQRSVPVEEDRLVKYHVDDIDVSHVPTRTKTEYYNKRTGRPIYGFNTAEGGGWALNTAGDGQTVYNVQFDPNTGQPIFYNQQIHGRQKYADLAPVLAIASSFFLPGLGTAIASGLGTSAAVGSAIASGLVSGTVSELAGGDFVKGAIKGAVTAGAGAFAADVGNALGITNNVAAQAVGNAVIKTGAAALTGGDVSTALIEGAISGALSGMKQDVAVKAAADADIAGGMVPEFGNSKTYDAFMAEAIKTGGVEQAVTSMLANTLTPSQLDAEFIAADAAQLATQGIGETQIKDVLNQYVSIPAASLAASMAVNNVPIETATQQLSNLSNNVGLFNAGVSDATLIAADALQLKDQVGFNAPAIEQNLTASGVDPLVAADVTQQIGTNPNLTETDLASNLSNFYGDKIYDTPVDTMITAPKVEEPVKVEEPAKTEPKINKGDIMKQMLKLAMAGGAASVVTSDKPKLPTSGLYTPATGDDIYKDAPIKGFAMRKYQDESGATRYTPFIGEKKLLDVPAGFTPAKGGLGSPKP